MTGITFSCPECQKRMRMRSSVKHSERSKTGYFYCENCDIKATGMAELTEIKKGVYTPYNPPQFAT